MSKMNEEKAVAIAEASAGAAFAEYEAAEAKAAYDAAVTADDAAAEAEAAKAAKDAGTAAAFTELAMSQSVQPMADPRSLFGTWPGEENDGFEKDIDELRHAAVKED